MDRSTKSIPTLLDRRDVPMRLSRFAHALILVAGAATVPAAAQGQQNPPTVQTPESQQAPRGPYDHAAHAPTAVSAPVQGTMRIDGVLDEAAWQDAPVLSGFRQLDPKEGDPVSERTEVRILYDQEAMYVGAWFYDRQPVSARLGRRDGGMSASDWLTIIFDANHDHRTAFGFEVNPAGVRRDQTRDPNNEDDSWDPVWQAATTVTGEGWFAEMRIPFSQLRYTPGMDQTWGLQIERQIARNQEFAVWSFTPRDQPAGIPRFGHLAGFSNLATGKRLEVMPYAVARSEFIDRGGSPFRRNSELHGNAGLDLKYRVTSSLTLDATVNPDFGQVEVDPAVINLTAFETQFQEKRPFFIEGSELFRFGNDGTNSVFYSRRIGRQPSVVRPYAVRDVPDQSRILGAAKLTGRTGSGWAMGVLNAVTQRETAWYDSATVHIERPAEPLTNFFVGRARHESRGGQSAIGGFVGAVNRNLDAPELENALRSAAYSAGLDVFQQWDERTWTLQGFLAGTTVRGTPGVMLSTQQLPYHYFQRPDAEHLTLDSARTSLSGLAGSMGINKRIGRHWTHGASFNTITPGYEVSDLGFQRRADRIDVQANTNFRQTRPGSIFRSWGAGLTGLMEHNYGGDNISNRIFYGAFGQLLNYWIAEVNFATSLAGTMDDRLTRGGPLAYRPGFTSVNAYLGSDQRKPIVGALGGYFQTGPGDTQNMSVFSELTFRPAPHWDVTVGPQFGRDIFEAQFLGRVPDPAATNTYGRRYLFASLDYRSVALVTRMNYTFTPSLSLQVYMQPLLASADFGPTKEFAAPREFRFLQYGRDIGTVENGRIYPNGNTGPTALSFSAAEPDFNEQSLRGNAVLRWEWRPGSTIYFAWQQARGAESEVGDFEFGRDTRALIGTKPVNIYLVKMSYWLNP